jgi:hypothetical protein
LPRIDTTAWLGENGGGFDHSDETRDPAQRANGLVALATSCTMTLRSALKTLLALALGLPVVQAVLFWVGGLLANMGDQGGAKIIQHVVTVCQVAWAVSVVGLVITLALVVLNERPVEVIDETEETDSE